MVPATLVADIRSPEGEVAGAIEAREVDGEVRGFAFRCPCGCGEESWLPVNRGDKGWQWDGNREKPTLSPSTKLACPANGTGFFAMGSGS